MSFTEFFGSASSVLTVASFLTFMGIVLWAYSGRRTQSFNEAALLPFADEISNGENSAEEHCAVEGGSRDNGTEARHG